jgi:uncharacterized membrane protein
MFLETGAAGMGPRISLWWQALRGSLWFVPSLMIVGAAALAVGMIELSEHVDRDALSRYPRFFGAGAESSRDMLGTIAGAMMTVAAVTFSITILAVAQTSSQYTPRVLRSFMRDRPSQLALGTLTGVFVYCLIVIRTIRGDEELRFIPAIAVLVAFALAIAAIGVLIYFIHHVAGSLDASEILARVRADTVAAIERLFPEEVGEERPAGELPTSDEWEVVESGSTGYITGLEPEGLLDFAEEQGVLVRMERGIGEYVIRGTPLVSVTPRPRADRRDVEKRINRVFKVAAFRTVEQDAEFGFRQMVDVAVRALSPGVNDTSTAIISVDAIGAALIALAGRRIEDPVRSRNGRPLVIARGPSFESLARVGLEEIRRNAEGNVSVLGRLLATIRRVLPHAPSGRRSDLLVEHARRVMATAERTVPDAHDLDDLRRSFERTLLAAGDRKG